MRLLPLVILLLSCCYTPVMSAEPAETPVDPRLTPEVLSEYERHTIDHAGLTLPYRMLRPIDQQEGERYPLVVFLHGFGERGDENQRQLIHGGRAMADETLRRAHPAFVLAPQCPAGYEPGTVIRDRKLDPEANPKGEAPRVWTWGLNRKGPNKINLARKGTPQLEAVRALVRQTIEQQAVDPDRVYVIGLSMGGYGTWEIISRDPELYAAAVPICGGGDPEHAERIAGIPIWVTHGEVDGVIPPERAYEMLDALKKAGNVPIYSEYEGVGHDSWTPTFNARHLWDWMFSQQKER